MDSMVRMKREVGAGAVSVGGQMFDVDANGFVMVPAELADNLYAFGFINAPMAETDMNEEGELSKKKK